MEFQQGFPISNFTLLNKVQLSGQLIADYPKQSYQLSPLKPQLLSNANPLRLFHTYHCQWLLNFQLFTEPQETMQRDLREV